MNRRQETVLIVAAGLIAGWLVSFLAGGIPLYVCGLLAALGVLAIAGSLMGKRKR